MLGKKRQVFREDLYLPKRQVKRVKRGDVVGENDRHFPWLALLLWIFFVGTFGYMLFFSPVMNIEVLHVEGNTLVPQSEIEKYFAEEREQISWKILKRQNFFLFRGSIFEKRLREELPAIEDVRIEKTFPNKLSVFVIERQTAILWCSRGPCALIRKDGRAAEGANIPEKRGTLPLYTIVDIGGLPIVLGDKIFNYPFVQNFEENTKLLKEEFGIVVKSDATSASRFSDEVRFTTEAGYELLLNLRLDPHQNSKFLHLFFDQEIPLDSQGELKSIDLRTENRIYYALKNSKPEEQEEVKTDGSEKKDESTSEVKPVTDKKKEKKTKDN